MTTWKAKRRRATRIVKEAAMQRITPPIGSLASPGLLQTSLQSWLTCAQSARLFCGSLLFRQFRVKCLLAFRNVTLVAFGIDKRVRGALFHSRKLRFHSIVISVRA